MACSVTTADKFASTVRNKYGFKCRLLSGYVNWILIVFFHLFVFAMVSVNCLSHEQIFVYRGMYE